MDIKALSNSDSNLTNNTKRKALRCTALQLIEIKHYTTHLDAFNRMSCSALIYSNFKNLNCIHLTWIQLVIVLFVFIPQYSLKRNQIDQARFALVGSCSFPRPFRLWSFVTSHPSLSFNFLTVSSVIKKQRAQRVQMKSGKTIHMCYAAGILQHTVNPEGSDNSVAKGIMSPIKVSNTHLRKTRKSV